MFFKLLQLKEKSPEILAAAKFYPQETAALIAENGFNDIGDILLDNINKRRPMVHYNNKREPEYFFYLEKGRFKIRKKERGEDKSKIITYKDFSELEKRKFPQEKITDIKNKLKAKDVKYQKWRKVSPLLVDIIEQHKDQPEWLFAFFSEIEIYRTKGRSKLLPLKKSPFGQGDGFPDILKVLKSFITSSTRSNKAINRWRLWLIHRGYRDENETEVDLASYDIQKIEDEKSGIVYEIPNRYYKLKNENKKGEYVLTKVMMQVDEMVVVRQQMKMLQSIAAYGKDVTAVKSSIELAFNQLLEIKQKKVSPEKKYIRISHEQSLVVLETLIHLQEKYTKGKPENQRKILKELDVLIEYFIAEVYHHNVYAENINTVIKRLEAAIRYLKEYYDDLASQYKRILQRRDNLAQEQMVEIAKLLAGKIKETKIKRSLLLAQAIASGYDEESTISNARQKEIKERISKIVKYIKILNSLYESKHSDMKAFGLAGRDVVKIIKELMG